MPYRRRIIKIKAEDSPNVQRALACIANGAEPDNKVLVPGVLTWERYQRHRAEWDAVRQCSGLDAEFWEGAENLLYPPEWLNRAEAVAASIRSRKRNAKAIGIDPAEGGDDTCWAVVDELGLIELIAKKTKDTSVITGDTIWLGKKHGVPAEKWMFDAGGGKTHADLLRKQGWPASVVAFGAAVSPAMRRGMTPFDERREAREERQSFKNLRAKMYWDLHELLDEGYNPQGFGIGAEHKELRRQLSLIPNLIDGEGKMYMLSKQRRPGQKRGEKTLTDLLGRSPDHADALVLAVHGMSKVDSRATAGTY